MPRIVKPPSGHECKKCPGCLATVEYAPNEVQERNGRDISGGPDGCKYVICPGCREWIVLERW